MSDGEWLLPHLMKSERELAQLQLRHRIMRGLVMSLQSEVKSADQAGLNVSGDRLLDLIDRILLELP